MSDLYLRADSLPTQLKYPRTPHLEGSRLQAGDEGHGQTPYRQLVGRHIVVEEKFDGGNAGISFSPAGELLLQSRGHYLSGGGRERQFNLFKQWAVAHEAPLLAALDDRYICFGEWMHKKHAMFYDALPHYFLEFDIWDRQQGCFLATPQRAAVLNGAAVLPVKVLYSGPAPKRLDALWQLIGPACGRSANWRQAFELAVTRQGLDLSRAWQQTDKSAHAEGLYIKVEDDGQVLERYKLVRQDFVQAILDADQHHASQPFIANQLAEGVDLFAPALSHDWESEHANC
ncbi:RNA ligase family protein [Chitinimonas sp.]|uniref:RNA ligase family protein n=1 Tax=Chitinimonas sp. TaxID=1934313 RepID=UPI0035B091E9